MGKEEIEYLLLLLHLWIGGTWLFVMGIDVLGLVLRRVRAGARLVALAVVLGLFLLLQWRGGQFLGRTYTFDILIEAGPRTARSRCDILARTPVRHSKDTPEGNSRPDEKVAERTKQVRNQDKEKPAELLRPS